MLSTLTIKGSEKDYKISPAGNSSGLLLIGVAPATEGVIVPLAGYQAVEFSNSVIELADTVWAEYDKPIYANFTSASALEAAYIDDEMFEQSQSYENSPVNISASTHARSGSAQLLNEQEPEQSLSKMPSLDREHHENQSIEESNNKLAPKNSHASVNDHRNQQTTKARPPQSNAGADQGLAANSENLMLTNDLKSPNSNAPGSSSAIDYLPKILFGTTAFNSLQGAEGNDIFYTSSGNDAIRGLGGLDTLIGIDFSAIQIDQISQDVYKLVGKFAEIYEAPIGFPNFGVF